MSSKIFSSIDDLIGRTPLMELRNLEKDLRLEAKLLAKLEYFNPTGSVKDRAAKYMLDAAEADGSLAPGGLVIEPTSGNTGIGLAALAAARGYRLIITMPENMSRERRLQMRAYGAQVLLTPPEKGMRGAIEKAEELHRQNPGSIIAGQFVNPANPEAHRQTTGPEIWRDTDGKVDIFVAGVGTGGTLTGVGEYLKSKNPGIVICAVEPADSPVLSGGKAGSHKIQGIGAGFVPQILNLNIIDEIIRVTNDDAFRTAKRLAHTEAILAGISSGAAAFAGIELARRADNYGKNIVLLLPDSGDRYLSAGLFE